jgi:hypothetical protein
MREGRTEHILLTVGTRGWVILQNEAVARTYAGAPAEGKRRISSRGDALEALCEGLVVFPSLVLPEYGEDGERIKYTLTLETRYNIIEKNLERTPDKTSSDEHKYLRLKDLKDKCDALVLTNTTASPFADVYLASTPNVEETISAADYLSELG